MKGYQNSPATWGSGAQTTLPSQGSAISNSAMLYNNLQSQITPKTVHYQAKILDSKFDSMFLSKVHRTCEPNCSI